MTRIQKERFGDDDEALLLFTDVLKHSPQLDSKLADYMPEGSGIMHPLPRGPEIKPDVDKRTGSNGRPCYFLQSYLGPAARAALLGAILKPNSYVERWLPYDPKMLEVA